MKQQQPSKLSNNAHWTKFKEKNKRKNVRLPKEWNEEEKTSNNSTYNTTATQIFIAA